MNRFTSLGFSRMAYQLYSFQILQECLTLHPLLILFSYGSRYVFLFPCWNFERKLNDLLQVIQAFFNVRTFTILFFNNGVYAARIHAYDIYNPFMSKNVFIESSTPKTIRMGMNGLEHLRLNWPHFSSCHIVHLIAKKT
jgi:hypothetical protein